MTTASNPKVGVNTVEFDKHITVTIIPLYSDVSDTKGKRVNISVNGGPGRVKLRCKLKYPSKASI